MQPRRVFRVLTLVFTATFLVVTAHTARAAPFSLATFVGANLGCVPNGPPPTGCPDFDGDAEANFQIRGPANGAGFVSVSDVTDGFNDPRFTYLAQADAAFGSLHAMASGSWNLPGSSYRGALAGAIASDLLTINGDGQSGQGRLDVTFQLDGTLQHTGNGGAAVLALVAASPNPDPFDGSGRSRIQGYDGTDPPTGPVTFSFDFVWGDPFYLTMALAAGVGTGLTCLSCDHGDANFQLASGAGTGSADFFNTLVLTGLVPTVNGNPVLNAQFSSASGTQYSVNGVVPEPASLLLLGTGLAGFAVKRRRRL